MRSKSTLTISNKPGQFGLELHLNTTPSGWIVPDYPGEISNNHGFRFTPKFSYGLRSNVELGLYLPMLIDGNGEYHFVGVKYRLKWLPIRPKEDGEGWFAGSNSELSRIGYKFSQSQWRPSCGPSSVTKARTSCSPSTRSSIGISPTVFRVGDRRSSRA